MTIAILLLYAYIIYLQVPSEYLSRYFLLLIDVQGCVKLQYTHRCEYKLFLLSAQNI